MKKVLSVVLALVMVLATMTMLVPTASAAVSVTDGGMTTGAGGKVYYEQNFNNLDATLVDKDLADAIGWARPGDGATMYLENGALRVVSQYTPDGVYPASANSWAGGYTTNVLTEADLTKNAIVLEYKFTYNRRAADPANDLTVTAKDGTSKTVKADGQGTYQFAAFTYSGGDRYIPRINMGGNLIQNPLKAPIASAQSDAWRNGAFTVYNTPTGGTSYTNIELNNNPSDSNAGTYSSTIMDKQYSVKVVVDPVAKFYYAYVDGVLCATMTMGWEDDFQVAKDKAGIENLVTDTLKLVVKCGIDVTLDDIKISEYVPAMTISEVMVNGANVNGTGKYQWVELTNPSDVAVNVYDYALHLFNMPTYNDATTRTQLIGAEEGAEAGTSDYYTGAGSTLGYFTPGAKTLANGDVFDSPAYADGVLQPGESAIVLFPQTAIAGETSVTDEAFNAYLTGLGMPAGTKTFVCDNKSDYNFSLAGNKIDQVCTVQVVKATNQATDGSYDPKADCEGAYVGLATAFAESTAIVTAKSGTSGTSIYGWAVKYMNDKYIKCTYSDANDHSIELSYSDYEHTGNNIEWGFKKYNTTETRKNQNGEDVYATPGFVPAEVARQVDIDVTDVTGTTSKVYGGHMKDTVVTLNTPQRKGSDVQIWVDGEMVVADVDTTTYELTIPAAEMTNDWHTVEVKYYDAEPLIIGFQQSEIAADGTYTIRVLAGVNNAFAYESVGFKLYIDLTGDGSEYKEADVECKFIYDSVTVAGETVSAKTYGVESLYAIHINGVPVDDYEGNMVISATATYTNVGGTATAARQGAMNFTPAVTPATPAE